MNIQKVQEVKNGQQFYKCPTCKQLVGGWVAWVDTDGKYKHKECMKSKKRKSL